MAEPFPEAGPMTIPLCNRPFVMAVPHGHELTEASSVDSVALKQRTILLLGNGHCFRDHALGVCPELSRFSQNADDIQKTLEGLSLETIRHMITNGVGVTVLPRMSVPDMQPAAADPLTYVLFRESVPDRRVVLAWYRSFTRIVAIEAVTKVVTQYNLPGIKLLPPTPLIH